MVPGRRNGERQVARGGRLSENRDPESAVGRPAAASWPGRHTFRIVLGSRLPLDPG